jgi:hypothetical protein
MGNRLAGICSSTVTTRIWFDEQVFADKLVTPGMGPVFLAACAAMQKQERLPGALCLVIDLDTVEVNAFGLHGAHYRGGHVKKQSGKSAW